MAVVRHPNKFCGRSGFRPRAGAFDSRSAPRRLLTVPRTPETAKTCRLAASPAPAPFHLQHTNQLLTMILVDRFGCVLVAVVHYYL